MSIHNALSTPNHPRRIRRLALASAIGGLALGATSVSAVELTAGDWKVDVGGYINAYYTTVSCSGDAVGGAALGSGGLGCGGEKDRTTIGNGLLPNALVTKFSTDQDGYALGGQIAIMAHTATDSAISPNSGVDVRQAFFTVGTPEIGTFKLGRDYGIFGSSAILSDMTLLGVGAPVQATQRGRVTLGHIGAGYTYLGNYGQVAWTSPVAGGVSFTGALVSPVDNGAGLVSNATPQIQAQVTWAAEGFKLWIGGKTQQFDAPSGSEADGFTMAGAEIGASLTAGRFGLLANVQAGKGLGILADGDQGNVKSTNALAQGTFGVTDKVKVGLSYGISRNRDNLPGTGGLRSNANLTAGVYWSLTKSVTLVAELGQTRSKGFDDATARMNGGSIGGIVFF